MDYKMVIFHTVGGLGLFLFGMRMMSESLQKVAGDRMRKILEAVSANRVVACITGAVVTGLIQSSSATTVMLVGFVNAGLMTMVQATGVALGANIGTTFTAQLIAFKVTDAALPAIALGVVLRLFGKKRRSREIGGTILGFGLLFYGMVVMNMGVSPLKDSPVFVDFFTRFQADSLSGIILCVLVGAGVTMLLQSSSATVGLTMTLATQGLLSFPGAVALILGDNIGTTITAELSSIGTDVKARRTARAHTLFNVLGVCYMVVLFPYFLSLVTWTTQFFLNLGSPDLVLGGEKPNIARYLANAHTMFNLVNAMFFLCFLRALVRVAEIITPDKEKRGEQELFKPQYLDFHFIELAPVALKQARQEIIRMGDIAHDLLSGVVGALEERKMKNLGGWRRKEDALDSLQREVTNFLIQASQQEISFEESKEISSLIRMTNNFERIGDSAENVAELIEEMIENDLRLTPEGVGDYREISARSVDFLKFLIESMKSGHDPHFMEKAREFENSIDFMREDMREKHLVRLRAGACSLDPGLIFTDMLNHFEKIGDYCFNVAQAVAGVK
ncbi:MAG: Na/Pi cotransporter family protein [Pseudomonadota bacterium]